jgi:hypothetical protein
LKFERVVTGGGSGTRVYLKKILPPPQGHDITITHRSYGLDKLEDDYGNGLKFKYSGATSKLTSVEDLRDSTRKATVSYWATVPDEIEDIESPEGIKAEFTYSSGVISKLSTPYNDLTGMIDTEFSMTTTSSDPTYGVDGQYATNEASPGQALSPRARLLLRRSGVSSKCCFIESAASGGELDP